jgi:hypothetical protein
MKVKAASLVLDFNLYPRHHVDEQCIADYVNVLKAGGSFPPVLVDKKTRRVVDGFKRTRAHLHFGGGDVEIEATFKTYASEDELLYDAIELNSTHGERLAHYDIQRCIILGRELRMSDATIAKALHLPLARFEKFAGYIHTGADGQLMASKQSSRNLPTGEGAKPLTQKQTEAVPKQGGNPQLHYVNQVILFIEARTLDKKNERLMERLEYLAGLLELFVQKTAA